MAGPSFPLMPGQPSPSVPPQGEPIPWWEDAAIVVAIGSLWPVVLRWPGTIWQIVLYCMAFLMIVVFVRRSRRLRRLSRRTSGDSDNDPVRL
jgi:hypothetical protein